MELVLEDGLVARPNVLNQNQLLITDQTGWKIYALVTRAESNQELTLAPRWQLGFRVSGQRLTLFKQTSPLVSPFEDDGKVSKVFQEGKRAMVYTSPKQLSGKMRNDDDRETV